MDPLADVTPVPDRFATLGEAGAYARRIAATGRVARVVRLGRD